MRQFNITSNIMSLGGLIISIGVLVDASIVMVENAYRNIAAATARGEIIDYTEISIKSAKQVGRAIFFSIAIIVVSFLPVFLAYGTGRKAVPSPSIYQNVCACRFGNHHNNTCSYADDIIYERQVLFGTEKPGFKIF